MGQYKCIIPSGYDPSDVRQRTIVNSLIEHLDFAMERLENEYVGIFLQGSQNYELDTPSSDVDTWLIVLPTMDELIFGKEGVSREILLPSGEHCCVKDIRQMFNMFRKQNINSLEALFTRWRLMNPCYAGVFSLALTNAEKIAHYDNYRFIDATIGMMRERNRKLTRDLDGHEYDGKCLSYVYRLHEFLIRYMINGESFGDCLVSKRRELLLAAKEHRYTRSCAIQTANSLIDEVLKFEQSYKDSTPHIVDPSVVDILNSVVSETISLYIENNISKYRRNEGMYENSCGLRRIASGDARVQTFRARSVEL